MHILQMAPYYRPYPGGQERYVQALSRALVDAGHRVTVITSDYPEKNPRRFEEDGVRVLRFRTLLRLFRNPFTPGMLFLPPDARDFDLIHAHNEHGFSSDVAVLLKSLHRKPLILTSHGNLVYGSRLPDAACRFYEATVGRQIFRRADRITAATPSEKERIASAWRIEWEKIEVIPVGIDLRFWKSYEGKGRLPAALEKTDPRTKVILCATQLIRRKGIGYLLGAVPDIRKGCDDFRIVLAGSGDAEGELRNLAATLGIADRVLFLGKLDEAELTAVYRRADVFVLPSIGEGQPTCIMEAWVHAKPVVATAISGVSDYYSDAAVLIPAADSPALAEAILHILRDPQAAKALGEKGKQLVESRFDWPIVVKRMLALYASVLGGRGADT
jgi:glycosyltransferase involved in cell wall biosynthesis